MIYNLRTACNLYMKGHITGNEVRDRLILVLTNYRDDSEDAREIDTLCELILGDAK